MARFDVIEMKDGGGLVVDCQADILGSLNTRIVVPLLPSDAAPPPAARLNPVFEIGGNEFVFVTQHASAVPLGELGRVVGRVKMHDIAIANAFDMLLTGY